MILNDIEEKLRELDENVYYGMVDKNRQELEWNYTVFDRERIAVNTNRTGYSSYFNVHIVRENFIPEGLEMSVIDKMLEIPGMRLANTDLIYTYAQKQKTNLVVEMVSISFVKPMKG